MSENDDTKPESQTLTFEPLGFLANETPQNDPSMNLFCFFFVENEFSMKITF